MERLDTVVVVDFGGQYTHLVARRVRGLGVFSRIVEPEDVGPAMLPPEERLVGVILSGGPSSVYDADAPEPAVDPRTLGVPVLGLCYGHQWLCRAAGGTVVGGRAREYGLAEVGVDPESPLFRGLPARQRVWMSHGDHVDALPAGWRVAASTPDLPVAAAGSPDGRCFGLQFHPEVVHTDHGDAIFGNFLDTCGARRAWQPHRLEALLVDRIRAEAGHRRLFLLVSGGVDSLVALALCERAVGPERLFGLHVDTGFMRLGESEAVHGQLLDLGARNVQVVDASARFLGATAGLVDPEAKRRAIGRAFVDEVQHALGGLLSDGDWMLVQGTIYPDRIESGGSRRAARIKTHHNRVEEIERLLAEGRVLEPLADLYKDEVRELGRALGLPDALVDRQPFPGPGLAVRVLCAVAPTDVPAGDAPQDDALAGLLDGGLQGRVLPVRSVGVQGDARTYARPAAVWGTGPVDWDHLLATAARVVNRLPGVNRVVWFPEGDPGPLRPVARHLDQDVLDRLRAVDDRAHRMTEDLPEIWQMPVVALPLVDRAGGTVYVLRPVTSRDAMTADVYRLDPARLAGLVSALRAIPGTGPVAWDLTTKPPGTIEWE